MVVMLEVTYPGAKAQEVGKAFVDVIQANPFPDYVKLVEDYSHWGADGIKSHLFYDLEKGKEEEGMRYITASTLELTRAVDGFRVLESSVVYTLAEAYAVVGMEGPAV
jgi:hypothetical protein